MLWYTDTDGSIDGEAKLSALSYESQEPAYLSNLRYELFSKERYISIYIKLDCTSALALTKNHRYIPRTNHGALRFNLLVEFVKRDTILVPNKNTKLMLAGIQYL